MTIVVDPIKSIVNKYKNHPSIKIIKSRYITIKRFSSGAATPKDVLDVISTLDDTKSLGEDITLRILKDKMIPEEHTGIPGLWAQVLDAGLWTLDSGLWTLNTVVNCCRTGSEPSF